MNIETFLKSVDAEYERRKPKSKQQHLTADALARLPTTTPSKQRVKKADNSGENSPLRDMLGLN